MKYDNVDSAVRINRIHRMALPEVKTFVLIAAVATLGGCAIYSDGTLGSAFDQGAIKRELARADKEYGSR